ncbi:MAG: LysM peptidoglycan-binding domain-containing protein [Georgfuchsia sp.]
MIRIISALFALFSCLVLFVQAAPAADTPLELAPDAPYRHVVVRGDTLWDLSGMYLKDPFRWPELWGFNKDQIKNPHWIYPGQVLVLDTSNGQPRLSIEGSGNGVPTVKLEPQVRITDQTREIPAIPQQVIEPFLSQPLVVDIDALETAPRIIATEGNRVLSAAGDLAYVTGIKAGDPSLWQIYRPGKAMKDPANDEVLGYEAVFLGSARLSKEGEPATIRIVNARQELANNDRLVPAPRPDIVNYPLHRPASAVNSRVVSIYGDSTAGGTYSIVAITGGKKNGMEVGHVLALSRTGQVITDRYRGKKTELTLPNERYGLLYVFRTFDKVSYGLVMKASKTVTVGDAVETP